jgi:hypothetical protein
MNLKMFHFRECTFEDLKQYFSNVEEFPVTLQGACDYYHSPKKNVFDDIALIENAGRVNNQTRAAKERIRKIAVLMQDEKNWNREKAERFNQNVLILDPFAGVNKGILKVPKRIISSKQILDSAGHFVDVKNNSIALLHKPLSKAEKNAIEKLKKDKFTIQRTTFK